jgi:hypothetical protein
MQDIYVNLNPGLPWQKRRSTRRRISSQANWTSLKEETVELLHVEYSFVWC